MSARRWGRASRLWRATVASWSLLVLLMVAVSCRGGAGADDGGAATEHEARGAPPDPTVIEECRDPCPGIDLERVATLGSPDDSVLLDWRSRLVAGDSFIAAGWVPVEGVVPLFDYRGSQVMVVGRYGGGPGEFRGPVPSRGPGGAIWVFDIGNQRLSVLGPEGRVVRETPFYGAPRRATPLDEAMALVTGFVARDSLDPDAYRPSGLSTGRRSESAPYRPPLPASPPPPFHVVDTAGTILTSFGDWPGFPGPAPCAVARGGGSSYLATVPGRYAVATMRQDGMVTAILERRVDWFEPRDLTETGPGLSTRRVRPIPGMCSMSLQGDSLWTRIYLPGGELESGQRVDLAVIDSIARVVIEVIDLEGPTVVARQSFGNPSLLFLEGTGMLYSASQDEAGYVTMDLWRARITGDP